MDVFASEYHWTEEDVNRFSYAELNELIRIINARHRAELEAMKKARLSWQK